MALDTNFMKYCRYRMTLLTHLDIYYVEGPLEVKRKLIGSIFTETLVFEIEVIEPAKLIQQVSLSGSLAKT
jgi:hypothetical protein